jgi:CheY-like chemotaxis protein
MTLATKPKAFVAEPGSAVRRRQGSILLVDDYADARATVREVLEGNGHAVVEATNGQEALDILVSMRGPQIGLIVLDLQMPVMDGWQFLKLLGNYVRLASIPVVIVSAFSGQMAELGTKSVVGRLQPPYDMDELVAIVDACTPPSLPP